MQSTSSLPDSLAEINSLQEIISFAQRDEESRQLVDEHISELIKEVLQKIRPKDRAPELNNFIESSANIKTPTDFSLAVMIFKNIAENDFPDYIKNESQRRDILQSMISRATEDKDLFQSIIGSISSNKFIAFTTLRFFNFVATHNHCDEDTITVLIGNLEAIINKAINKSKQDEILNNLTRLFDAINEKAITETHLDTLVRMATDNSLNIDEHIRCLLLSKVIDSPVHNVSHLDSVANFSDHIKSIELKTNLLDQLVTSANKTPDHERKHQAHHHLININSFDDLLQEVVGDASITNVEEVFDNVLSKTPRETLARDLNLFSREFKTQELFIDPSLEKRLVKWIAKSIVEGHWQENEVRALSGTLPVLVENQVADHETCNLIAANCRTFIPADSAHLMTLSVNLANHDDIGTETFNILVDLVEAHFNALVEKDDAAGQGQALPLTESFTSLSGSSHGAAVSSSLPLLNNFIKAVIQHLQPNEANDVAFDRLNALYNRIMPRDEALAFISLPGNAGLSDNSYFKKLTQQAFIRVGLFEDLIEQSNDATRRSLILKNVSEIVNGIMKSTPTEDIFEELQGFLDSPVVAQHRTVARTLIADVIENLYPDYLPQQECLSLLSHLLEPVLKVVV